MQRLRGRLRLLSTSGKKGGDDGLPEGFASILSAAEDLQGKSAAEPPHKTPKNAHQKRDVRQTATPKATVSPSSVLSLPYILNKDFVSKLDIRAVQQSSAIFAQLSTNTQSANSNSRAEYLPWKDQVKRNTQALVPGELLVTGHEHHFMNGYFLSRFKSITGNILSRRVTKLSSKQQRKVARAIKTAEHIGILPLTAKFLPPFENDLPGQDLSNPLPGHYRVQPRERDELRYMAPLDHQAGTSDPALSRDLTFRPRRVLRKLNNKEKLHKEDARLETIRPILGLPDVDELWSRSDLAEYIRTHRKIAIPAHSHSLMDLKFEAAAAKVHMMTESDIETYLNEIGMDCDDCQSRRQYLARVNLLLCAFEEYCLDEMGPYLGNLL